MVLVKKSLSEQIYELLRNDILSRKLDFGEKIINRDLQERYGVSSTPVRDAVNRLYQDGLIENITRVGARVISFDRCHALEINEIVSLLCTAAVKLSVKSDAYEVCSHLEEAVEMQKYALDTDKFFDYDYIYHKTFFNYCNNSRLKSLYKQYSMLNRLWVTYFHDQITYREESVKQHQEILRLYREGKVTEAQGFMEYHFAHAGELIKEKED